MLMLLLVYRSFCLMAVHQFCTGRCDDFISTANRHFYFDRESGSEGLERQEVHSFQVPETIFGVTLRVDAQVNERK